MAESLTNDPNVYPSGDFVGHEPSRGLTKRELFAAMAMQGLCATWDAHNYGLAERSVQLADALLTALQEVGK